MTRLLLTWIALAVLQLGTPRAVSATELLRPVGEPTTAAPRAETPSRDALARERSRRDAVQIAHVTSFAPAASSRIPLALAHGEAPTDAPYLTGPASLPRVLPDARAPPA